MNMIAQPATTVSASLGLFVFRGVDISSLLF